MLSTKYLCHHLNKLRWSCTWAKCMPSCAPFWISLSKGCSDLRYMFQILIRIELYSKLELHRSQWISRGTAESGGDSKCSWFIVTLLKYLMVKNLPLTCTIMNGLSLLKMFFWLQQPHHLNLPWFWFFKHSVTQCVSFPEALICWVCRPCRTARSVC